MQEQIMVNSVGRVGQGQMDRFFVMAFMSGIEAGKDVILKSANRQIQLEGRTAHGNSFVCEWESVRLQAERVEKLLADAAKSFSRSVAGSFAPPENGVGRQLPQRLLGQGKKNKSKNKKRLANLRRFF